VRLEGCGDNSCMFGASGGMGTNCGCRCLEHILPPHARAGRVRVRANVSKLRARVAELEVELARLLRERVELMRLVASRALPDEAVSLSYESKEGGA